MGVAVAALAAGERHWLRSRSCRARHRWGRYGFCGRRSPRRRSHGAAPPPRHRRPREHRPRPTCNPPACSTPHGRRRGRLRSRSDTTTPSCTLPRKRAAERRPLLRPRRARRPVPVRHPNGRSSAAAQLAARVSADFARGRSGRLAGGERYRWRVHRHLNRSPALPGSSPPASALSATSPSASARRCASVACSFGGRRHLLQRRLHRVKHRAYLRRQSPAHQTIVSPPPPSGRGCQAHLWHGRASRSACSSPAPGSTCAAVELKATGVAVLRCRRGNLGQRTHLRVGELPARQRRSDRFRSASAAATRSFSRAAPDLAIRQLSRGRRSGSHPSRGGARNGAGGTAARRWRRACRQRLSAPSWSRSGGSAASGGAASAATWAMSQRNAPPASREWAEPQRPCPRAARSVWAGPLDRARAVAWGAGVLVSCSMIGPSYTRISTTR